MTVAVKVFLSGEGPNELGTRASGRGTDPGVVETLLRRVRPSGWEVDGVEVWSRIRSYAASRALRNVEHDDVRNLHKLLVRVYEKGCEMLVFVRDVDNEPARADALRTALEQIEMQGYAEDYGYSLQIVGTAVEPTLEGWILCLRGDRHAGMTPTAAEGALGDAGVELKSTAAYVAIAKTGTLPTHDCSLKHWLDDARAAFARLIDGAPQ